MAALVELRRVHKHFNPKTKILHNINLTIKPHNTLTVLNPSKSGKSTLLNIIGGLLPPNEGEVLFNNKPLTNHNTKQQHTPINHANSQYSTSNHNTPTHQTKTK